MIKLIIFDLSEVCFNSEETIYLKEFSQRHNLNYEELVNFYDQLLIQAEIGTISGKEIWDKIFIRFGIENETFEKVLKEMMALRKPNADTLKFVKELRKKYKTAYLTNYNKDYWEFLIKQFDLNPYFDYGVVSYQIKARKPSAEGIKKILTHFAVKPEETIFTDDLVKNLIEADKLGINTIHFEHIDLFKDLLKEFKVNIGEE